MGFRLGEKHKKALRIGAKIGGAALVVAGARAGQKEAQQIQKESQAQNRRDLTMALVGEGLQDKPASGIKVVENLQPTQVRIKPDVKVAGTTGARTQALASGLQDIGKSSGKLGFAKATLGTAGSVIKARDTPSQVITSEQQLIRDIERKRAEVGSDVLFGRRGGLLGKVSRRR